MKVAEVSSDRRIGDCTDCALARSVTVDSEGRRNTTEEHTIQVRIVKRIRGQPAGRFRKYN